VAFANSETITWWYLAPPFAPLHYAAAVAGGGLVCFVSLYYCDAYRPAIMCSLRRSVPALVCATGISFVAATMGGFAFSTTPKAIPVVSHIAGFYFAFLLVDRGVFRAVSSSRRFTQRVLVIGASELGSAIAEVMREHPNFGYELVGFLSDEADFSFAGASISGFPILGRVHKIEKIVDNMKISRIVVASKSRDEHFPAEALLNWKMAGIPVESGVSFYERVSGKIYLQDLRPSYLIFSNGFNIGPFSRAVTRAIDAIGAAGALLLASPVILLSAIAIKLESPGPVFYRQVRVGQGNKPFRIVKLRSMREDAERHTGPVFANQQDDRITAVGRILRKSRLDEVPQLWNVLRGEMSLVGPRPERPEFVETLSDRYPLFRLRSAVKPGVTGWAQIRYGYVNEVDGFLEKLAYDLYYMKYRSVGMDLLVLWQTIKTVVLFRGL
jgi:sugar transferase (PEP-CTERM system associated)